MRDRGRSWAADAAALVLVGVATAGVVCATGRERPDPVQLERAAARPAEQTERGREIVAEHRRHLADPETPCGICRASERWVGHPAYRPAE